MDDHPASGEYDFAVAQRETATVEYTIDPAVPLPTEEFGQQSPVYAGIRWLMYIGLLGAIGAATFGMMMASLTGTRGGLHPTFAASTERGAAGVGVVASVVLLVLSALRLQAHSHAYFDQGLDGERFSLLMESHWGSGWLLQVGGSLIALMGFKMAHSRAGVGTLVAAMGCVLLGFSVGLSGHAATLEGLGPAVILMDSIHVLAAGAWLGTLLILLIVVAPRLKSQKGDRSKILSALLPPFSTIALTCGGVTVASGVFAAAIHMNGVTDLWSTSYGKLLSAKLFLAILVFSAALFNWKRFQPKKFGTEASIILRRRATIELATAALVVGLTAFLVSVPAPKEQHDDTTSQATVLVQ